jgi:hypothetical protein
MSVSLGLVVVVAVAVVAVVAVVVGLEVAVVVGSGSLEVVEVVEAVAAFVAFGSGSLEAVVVVAFAFVVAFVAFVVAFVAFALGAVAAALKTAASVQGSNLLKMVAQEPKWGVAKAAAKAEAEPDLPDAFSRQKWKRRYSSSKMWRCRTWIVDINAHDTIKLHSLRILCALRSHRHPDGVMARVPLHLKIA